MLVVETGHKGIEENPAVDYKIMNAKSRLSHVPWYYVAARKKKLRTGAILLLTSLMH